jgi:type II secretory ATPase GspE/PulE/Tfp pilus assembly ATPase PilB-like protein
MSDLQIADAIRSAAGQDPDLIVVGEIWDAQTLAGAAEAAMAGRLVLGRLHERTAPAALELVRKSGLSPWRLATALLGVVAQTTARKLCPACRREGQPADAALNRLGLRCDDPALAGATFPTFAPAGCKQCFNTGYAGRTGVFSILEVRDESACLLRDGAGSEAICEVAGRMGMKTLPQAAMELARSGGTSVEELARAF